jgi:glutamate-5-semialdehyde dehydrogenase
LTASQYIDMIIPRGGAGLHEFALKNATIPVITGGIGICHIYVDRSADPEKVITIVHNSKVQRPTVCNALDTLLIHREVAQELLPKIAEDLASAGVELRCEPRALRTLMGHPAARTAGPRDFDTEFLSLVLAVKVVDNLDEALDHIYQHSTHHSDAILTEDYSQAMRFINEVDSAVVYVNASTRFTDGGQLGLGAEVAVSTQRLHARGPMSLKELTTYKWVVFGDGQVRE